MATKLAQKVARIHQSQNPSGESKNQNGPYGSWIRGVAGAASAPLRPRVKPKP